jgi:hypothetical protein
MHGFHCIPRSHPPERLHWPLSLTKYLQSAQQKISAVYSRSIAAVRIQKALDEDVGLAGAEILVAEMTKPLHLRSKRRRWRTVSRQSSGGTKVLPPSRAAAITRRRCPTPPSARIGHWLWPSILLSKTFGGTPRTWVRGHVWWDCSRQRKGWEGGGRQQKQDGGGAGRWPASPFFGLKNYVGEQVQRCPASFCHMNYVFTFLV